MDRKKYYSNDIRYNFSIEEISIISYFFYEQAVIVQEINIPYLREPSQEQLMSISGPQEYHKYIALELLKKEGFKKKDIFIEFSIYGRRADIYANKDNQNSNLLMGFSYILLIIIYIIRTS